VRSSGQPLEIEVLPPQDFQHEEGLAGLAPERGLVAADALEGAVVGWVPLPLRRSAPAVVTARYDDRP
jgi:hypothetical protein